jgi:NADH-quinone oxidoreductase subunit N
MFNSASLPLLTTEIILVGLAVVGLFLDLRRTAEEKKGEIIANVSIAGVAAALLGLGLQWGKSGICFKGAFSQDGVSYFFKALFLAAGIFTLFMAKNFQAKLKHGRGEFILLIVFSLIGMSFLASANDFVLFFVSIEILTVSLYILTAYLRDQQSAIEAGIKFLIMGALSTAVFLYGLSFIYGATGSTSFAEIRESVVNFHTMPAHFVFGMVLVIASLGFKIGAFPFHLWVPDVYEGAPTPVTAYLAIGSKAAGFAGLVRLLLTVFSPAMDSLSWLFGILAGLTILYGNLGAIPQTNVKRLLGYSSIGHAGYLLIGLATFFYSGEEALLYYLLSYLFSTAGVFLVLVALSHHSKTDEIHELAGLSERSPLLAAGMLLSLLSLAGIPPLAGFFAKFYLLWAAVKSGMLWLAAIGALSVVLSLYYYLKIVKVMYLEKPSRTGTLKISNEEKLLQYACLLGILALGIFQGPFVKFVGTAFLKF